MSRPRSLVILLAAFSLEAMGASQNCADNVFKRFDSRLAVKPIARLSDLSEKPVGFEIVNGHAIIAFSHRLLALGASTGAAISSLEPIKGLAVDGFGHIRFQTNKDLRLLSSQLIEVDSSLSPKIQGRLFGSGSNILLDVTELPTEAQFFLTTEKGHSLPLCRIAGKFHTGSWNSVGLAAIVGDRLIGWEIGAKRLVQLAADKGLEQANDVVLIGHGRAVVSLEHLTLLISPETTLVLIGVPTRCRWNNGVLYLLDEKTGLVWKIDGMQSLGSTQADRNRGRAILSSLSSGTIESSSAFLDAARIVGCAQARASVK